MNQTHFWRQDITGLRALAVIPVLLFHAFPTAVPGGFFGVDIFFVISGYLISGIIFRGLREDRFSFADFYTKRVKRIVPALVVVLLFIIAVGWAILFKEEFEEIIRYIVGSDFFFMNFRLISRANDYFQTDAESLPLLHIWSLSIEEQFYILFPLICFCIWKFSRRKEAILGWFVLLLTVGSFVSCIATQDGLYRFYFPTSRFWELGVGILLAYAETFKRNEWTIVPQNGAVRSALSVAALALILGAVLLYSPEIRTPGCSSLLAVGGAVCLIAAKSDALVNRTLLSWRPFVFIGLISYSLYLWHWPLLVYFGLVFGESTVFWRICVLLVAFALSVLMYLIVEVPVRRTKVRGAVPILFVLLIVCVALPYGVRKGVLPSVWMDINSRTIAHENALEEQFPTMRMAGVDVPVATLSVKPHILVTGDSHAGMYFERAAKQARENGQNAVLLYAGACFITDGYQIRPGEQDEACPRAHQQFEVLIKDESITVLVLGQKWGDYANFSANSHSERVRKFRQTLTKFMGRGGNVFVLEDIPWTPDGSKDFDKRAVFRHNVIESGLVPWSRWRDQALNVPLPSTDKWKRGNEAMRRMVPDGVHVIEAADKVCPNGLCDLRWYRDEDHLLRGWVRDNAGWLDVAFPKPEHNDDKP